MGPARGSARAGVGHRYFGWSPPPTGGVVVEQPMPDRSYRIDVGGGAGTDPSDAASRLCLYVAREPARTLNEADGLTVTPASPNHPAAGLRPPQVETATAPRHHSRGQAAPLPSLGSHERAGRREIILSTAERLGDPVRRSRAMPAWAVGAGRGSRWPLSDAEPGATRRGGRPSVTGTVPAGRRKREVR
jgi:hypothetical protein